MTKVLHNNGKWKPDPNHGLTDAGEIPRFRPINIKRVNLGAPTRLLPHDTFNLTIKHRLEQHGLVINETEERLPPFVIDREIIADHVIRFEIFDELGVDVGLGFILGQKSK